jgi:hypothetical protein
VSGNLDMRDPALAPMGGEQLPIPQARRPKMPSQVPLLLVILAISGGALYSMRQYGMKSGFKFQEVKVDIKEEDSEKARTYERIMADLARVQNPLDVTLTEFGNSPFMRAQGEVTYTPEVGMPTAEMTIEERRRIEAVDTLKRMKLRGIIGNVARIDDMSVRVGDRVGDIFTVTSIEGRTVTFEAHGEVFTLTLEAKKPMQKQSPTRVGEHNGR